MTYTAGYISTIQSQIGAINLASLRETLKHSESTTTKSVSNEALAGKLGGVTAALDAIHQAYDTIDISGVKGPLASYISALGTKTPSCTELDAIYSSLSNVPQADLKNRMHEAYQVNSTSLTYNADIIDYYTNVFNEIKNSGYSEQSQDKMISPEWLQGQIDMGNLFLYEKDPKTNENKNLSWSTGDNTLKETYDDRFVAKAKAEYDVTINAIQSKEKRMDLDLKQIDAEHNETKTEIESLSKIINKNIERTLKIFEA